MTEHKQPQFARHAHAWCSDLTWLLKCGNPFQSGGKAFSVPLQSSPAKVLHSKKGHKQIMYSYLGYCKDICVCYGKDMLRCTYIRTYVQLCTHAGVHVYYVLTGVAIHHTIQKYYDNVIVYISIDNRRT